MNFEFSDDEKMIQEQAAGFLNKFASIERVRKVLDDDAISYDQELWQGMVEMGWTAASIPEAYGGLELGYPALCVIAEQLGRTLAPTPFASSVYLATELLLNAGSEEQKQAYLPQLAAGEKIGTLARSEGRSSKVTCEVRGGALYGSKLPVVDGDVADFAVVVANAESGAQSLYLVDLTADGVTRSKVETIDPTRSAAQITFEGAAAELLGEEGAAQSILAQVDEVAAVLFAFEQLGGSQACLKMARAYSMERYVYGQPIATFQAIKHKLADIFTAIELLRSNALYAAMCLEGDRDSLPLAAATARVAGIKAFGLASQENIQTHGGMGFTWEFDCHLYYRRAQTLGVVVGNETAWKKRIVAELKTQTIA